MFAVFYFNKENTSILKKFAVATFCQKTKLIFCLCCLDRVAVILVNDQHWSPH